MRSFKTDYDFTGMRNWGVLPFAQESRTVQSDALFWEAGKTLLKGMVPWRMEHESEDGFLTQHLGDAS